MDTQHRTSAFGICYVCPTIRCIGIIVIDAILENRGCCRTFRSSGLVRNVRGFRSILSPTKHTDNEQIVLFVAFSAFDDFRSFVFQSDVSTEIYDTTRTQRQLRDSFRTGVYFCSIRWHRIYLPRVDVNFPPPGARNYGTKIRILSVSDWRRLQRSLSLEFTTLPRKRVKERGRKGRKREKEGQNDS